MSKQFPFGQPLRPVIQTDRSPKNVFVLGVYASAVHAKWKRNGKIICQALAVASEPWIFWDGNVAEAQSIIQAIPIPAELGTLEPAGSHLNGPSAKVLDQQILAPLGYTRQEAWLCDCLPEARLNPSQMRVIRERYDPLAAAYNLNPVTVPERPTIFCDEKRAAEITEEWNQSQAERMILLGDVPIAQYLKRVADVSFSSLGEYVAQYGYGNPVEVTIGGKTVQVLPLAHPRQIGALGAHSEKWHQLHRAWLAGKS